MSNRPRKLGFALLTTLGVLLLVELGARGWESMNPALPPVKRALSAP